MTTPFGRDPGALPSEEQLFKAFYPRVRGFFRSRGCSHEEAEDLSQEALVRVFQNMGKLRSPGSADNWILRICANLWKNELRHRSAKKRDVPMTSLDQAIDEGIESADRNLAGETGRPDALVALLSEEEERAVRSCVEELPPKMRQCLELHLHQDRTYGEIATLLHIAVQTVKSHLHQAKAKVKACTEHKLGGSPAG